MILNQKYTGGDFIIPREKLEELGIDVGDVLTIQAVSYAPVSSLEPRNFSDEERQKRLKLFQELQDAWQEVDLSDFEAQREAMWQTWGTSANC